MKTQQEAIAIDAIKLSDEIIRQVGNLARASSGAGPSDRVLDLEDQEVDRIYRVAWPALKLAEARLARMLGLDLGSVDHEFNDAKSREWAAVIVEDNAEQMPTPTRKP